MNTYTQAGLLTRLGSCSSVFLLTKNIRSYMKEVLLTVLSGLAFGLLSLFGSEIALFKLEYQVAIVSAVTTLLMSKMVVINATYKGIKQVANNACTAFEIALNLLVFSYHMSSLYPLIAASVGIVGWVAMLVFIGATLILWIKKTEK